MRRTAFVFIALFVTLSAAAQLQRDPMSTIEDYLARKLALGSIPPAQPGEVRSLVNVQFIQAANAQRTDQQTTATSSSPQSMSNLEKTGIADLLALAIEKGRITQTSSDKAATLSTTPYAIATFFGLPDTLENWDAYKYARRLSLSGSFAKDVAKSADFSTFSSGEAKFVVYGSRSPRDAALQADVHKQLDQAVSAALNRQTGRCSEFISSPYAVNVIIQEKILNKFGDWLADNPTANQDVIDKKLESLIPNPQAIDATSKVVLVQCVAAMSDLGKALTTDREQTKKLIDAYVKSNKALQLSASYLYVRDLTIADYSGYKVLLSADRSPRYSLNLNGEVDINETSHVRTSPAGTLPTGVTPGAAIKRVRGYSVETGLSFGRFGNGRGDATLSMKWEKPKGIGTRSTATGAGQLNIHFNDTITLPVALNYTSRDTTAVKKGLRLTFGLSSVLDAFLSNAVH